MPDLRRPITATMVVDLWRCERRMALDLFGDPTARDEVGDFVRMLWADGVSHEEAVLADLGGPAVDLREVPWYRRRGETARAVAARAPRILGAAMAVDDLLGMPDVMELVGDGYVAGDVKSGSAADDVGDRPRAAYAIQIAHYAAILEALGWGGGRDGFVVDRARARVPIAMSAAMDREGTALRDVHAALLADARVVAAGGRETRPAASADCGMCHWRTVSRAELVAADDPTLLPQVGRSLRALLPPELSTASAIAAMDVVDYVKAGRSTIAGVGAARLARMRDRAVLLTTPGAAPYARRPLHLPVARRELHLDLESDPLGGNHVYLHGVWERATTAGGVAGEYRAFLSRGPDDERRAFAEAVAFLRERPDGHLYVWSRFERTGYRMLDARHPGVCAEGEVEALFSPDRCTDLYTDVVAPHTEWPLGSYGLKPIAKSLGFAWSAADAGGAASIGWYREWKATGDEDVLARILDYNRSDVIATAVVLDALRGLEVRR